MTVGGFGVKIRIDITGSQTEIVSLLEGDLPELEKILAESTGHNATGGWATHVATGKRKINEFKMTLGWDDTAATHAALLTAFNASTTVNMSVVAPDGSETISFAAHITKMGRVSEQEDLYKCEVTVQPSGAPTIT